MASGKADLPSPRLAPTSQPFLSNFCICSAQQASCHCEKAGFVADEAISRGCNSKNIGEKRIAGRGKPQGGLQCRRRGEASADEAWDRSGGCTADASPVRG